MSELYGAPSGITARIQDEHTQATTRYNESMAQKLEQEAQAAQRLQQLMQQQGLGQDQVGTVQDPAARLSSLANLAIQSGNVKLGSELADKASQIDLRRQQGDRQLALIEKDEFEMNLKIANGASELAKTATDETSWRRANASFELLFGQPSPYAGLPYSPELVQTIQKSLTKAAEQLTAEYREKEHKRKLAHDKEVEQTARSNLGLREQELRLKRERETRLAKNGGSKLKPAGMPGKSEIVVAERLLENLGFEGAELEDAATDIAQEARRLWKANPAITPQEAMAQVVLQKQQSGDIVPGRKSQILSLDPKFGRSGKAFSPLRPAPAPTSPKDLVVGQYYTTQRGIAKWTGKAFTPAKVPQMSYSSPGGEDNEDEE